MEDKPKPFVSLAQSSRAYQEYKKGNISYEQLMRGVHATGDMSKLPERVETDKPAPQPTVDKKRNLGIRGLV